MLENWGNELVVIRFIDFGDTRQASTQDLYEVDESIVGIECHLKKFRMSDLPLIGRTAIITEDEQKVTSVGASLKVHRGLEWRHKKSPIVENSS